MAGSEYRIGRLGWQCRIGRSAGSDGEIGVQEIGRLGWQCRIGPGWQCRIGPECRIDWRCRIGRLGWQRSSGWQRRTGWQGRMVRGAG